MMFAWLLGAAYGACTVISGATVHSPDGPLRGRSLVIDGERIAAVGVDLPGMELVLSDTQDVEGARWQGRDCGFIQGAGRELTAGIVAVDTLIGVQEIGMEKAANDADAGTPDGVRAALRATDAYDPRSPLVGVNRLGGVTTTMVGLRGGHLVHGQAGVVQLSGASQAQTVLDPSVAMLMSIPTGSWAEGLRQLRELMADVNAYARDPGAYRGNRQRALFPDASALDLEALVPVAKGTLPLVVTANRASEIESLLATADELGLRLILRGAAEGWLVADQLAKAKVPVILNAYARRANSYDARFGSKENAKRLSEAGVDVTFVSMFATHNAHLARHAAGNAVRAGMAHEAAVASLTDVPARMLGLDERGRLEAGAIADVVLWSGDPLEVTSWGDQVWIMGRELPMESRQTLLRDRYLGR